jgi:hypothetical protein
MPQPGGNQTPYGFASQFNPQYSSFLPQDPNASANVGDLTRQEYGAPTQLLQQQQAAPMVAPQAQGPDMNSLRTMLASLAKATPARDKHATMWRGGR